MHRILFVDDEPPILKSLKRLFALHGDDVLIAESGAEALDIISELDISVCVADQRMPGMSGTDLLTEVKRLSPFTMRLVLTGYTDLNSLLGAINKGEIFRFILKPWKDAELVQTIHEAVTQYEKNIKQAESTLLALAETIELKDSYTKGHCERVAKYSVAIANELKLGKEMLSAIRSGAWLHDCGKIGVQEDILNLPGAINAHQMAEIQKHPEAGARVARIAELSEKVVNIILHHHEKIDGTGYPAGLKGPEIPLEARIVAVADVYDAVSTDRPYRKACTTEETIEIMLSLKGSSLDEEIVDILLKKILPFDEIA